MVWLEYRNLREINWQRCWEEGFRLSFLQWKVG